MPHAHLQILLADETMPLRLTQALERIHATTSQRSFAEALRSAEPPHGDAFVLVAPDHATETIAKLRLLLDRIAERPRAVLVLGPDEFGAPRIEHPPVVPVILDRGNTAIDVLAARITSILDMRSALAALHGAATARRAAEEHNARRYIGQLRLAGQAQREFMPARFPEVPGLSFFCVSRPVEYVSGDFYEVQRLDDSHIGIAVADATGHGIPAALLTVLVKRAMRGRSPANDRILTPAEVLSQLNAEILEANLTQCRFVAASYALYNTRTRELSIARGGAPYPLLRRADGSVEQLRSEGGIVGVLADMTFECIERRLEFGDEVVFHTDGIETLIASQAPTNLAAESFSRVAGAARRVSYAMRRAAAAPAYESSDLALAETTDMEDLASDVHVADVIASQADQDAAFYRNFGEAAPPPDMMTSPWLHVLRENGAYAALDQLRVRFDILRRLGQPPADDVTVLGMRVKG